jgi:hypothetical protein
MENKITLTHDEIMASLAKIAGELINKSDSNGNVIDDNYVSPFAAWLLSKADKPVVRKNGILLSKSEVDDVTLDFTMGRTLTEEDAEATIRFIYDKSPYLSMFNSRTVDKLVVPIEGKSITKKNLVSNEQNGGAVATVNRRIVHNFGINLYLKNINLQKDIPLQTVVNNMYNPSFEAETMSDVAIALANDILLLATNGLEYASYASSENFYDLNKGFVRILQLADGKNTNTYGSVTVVGFNGEYLTPQKVNAVGCTGTNYTSANLLTLMRSMYKAMLPQYRSDSGNVWMMSQVDADLYMDSRSDMTGVSNTTREATLTAGLVPNFMGHRIVVIPDMLGINETHEYQSTVPGAIIFGNPKNIDIAMSTRDMVTSTDYNARGTYGATYEYDFQGYMDVHVSKPESFVIAFNGATVSQPVLVTAAGSTNGNSGECSLSTATYTVTGDVSDGTNVFYACCDNNGSVMVKASESMAAMTYAQALGASGAAIVPQNGAITIGAGNPTVVYLRAYHPNLAASAQVTISATITS